MLLVLKSNTEELGREAARIVANAVRRNPGIRLGLATGSTTLGMYKELVRLHREESLDFSRVVTFNLDEYLGLSAAHPQSFHYFMREQFFAHVNIPERSIHIPDGAIRGDYDKYCASYEQSIRDAGGAIRDVAISYPRDFLKQQLEWAPVLAEPAEPEPPTPVTPRPAELATPPAPNRQPPRVGGDDAAVKTVRRDQPKVGRNDPCPCGSGKKYKKCHGQET